jgi:hypothetical protein
MINVSDKFVEKIKACILYAITFLGISCYDVTWKNIVVPDGPEIAV